MSPLRLGAPLAGWAAPLEETPDPVFAGKMMGEGLAIDPTGAVVVAPCDGVVIKLHAARHAVSLRADNGAEILIHLGVDTVALKGDGFRALAADGAAVRAGDPLIAFDLDALAQRAPSLMSPVLVTNPEAFDVRVLAVGREVSAGEPVLELTPRAQAALASGGTDVVRRVRVTHPHGLHARPAGLIATEAKRAAGEVQIRLGPAQANARSPVAIMALGVAAGDEIEVAAAGPGAEAVAEAILQVIGRINAAPAEAPAPPAPARPQAEGDSRIHGVTAAPGLAVGPLWRRTTEPAPVRRESAGEAAEAGALDAALSAVAADLAARRDRLAGEARAVVEAHIALLDDPELRACARRALASGSSAGVAWRDAAQAYVGVLERTGDARLAERAADLKDLEQQVLWRLVGAAPAAATPPPGAILLADDLPPSELIALQGAGLAGLCTAGGGPTSHVAVLAAAMDLPALVATGPAVLGLAGGGPAILDADRGLLDPAPGAAALADARAELAARAARHAEALAAARAPAATTDGIRIEVLANVGAPADAALAERNGAEGCGLLRTEFLFLERASPPTEDEQARAYQQVAEALPGRPVVVRTLDVGGDKPAPYLALPPEENPALGVRGVRVSLQGPDLLGAQLRAILRLAPGRCHIMVPMVASAAELAAVRDLLAAEAEALGCAVPPLGVMVETPAAAATVDLLAPYADFISLGTNDLAQYALAMDRGNPALAAEVDGLHPAVLRLIRLAAEAATGAGLPVSVCGGLASDPAAVPILLGLGVRTLSVVPARIPEIKACVRGLDLSACRALADQACRQASAAEVRALGLAPPARPARSRKGSTA